MIETLIRGMTADDSAFVFTSWLLSAHYSPVFERIDWERYKQEYRSPVTKALSKADVSVAVDPDDPYVIWGFAVVRDDMLDYVYVKQQFRGNGVGTRLLSKLPDEFVCTHIPQRVQLFNRLCTKAGKTVHYDPIKFLSL